jgi:hypothetical protein
MTYRFANGRVHFDNGVTYIACLFGLYPKCWLLKDIYVGHRVNIPFRDKPDYHGTIHKIRYQIRYDFNSSVTREVSYHVIVTFAIQDYPVEKVITRSSQNSHTFDNKYISQVIYSIHFSGSWSEHSDTILLNESPWTPYKVFRSWRLAS